jgi:acetylornithine deacetylase
MKTLELLERLVSFPTVSRESNMDLIDFVSGFLRERSAQVRLFRSSDGRKANLFGSLGPSESPGIMLSGHTDVVPVDGQSWTSDTFKLTSRGSSFHARGAADMKGFIASALAAFHRAKELHLRMPLQIALSYDEEIGCVGVRSMIEDMESWSVRPMFCIVGEPTLMQVATGHKGKTAMKAVCSGHAVHSALAPRGVNAIHLATDLVSRLRSLQTHVENFGVRENGYDIPYSTIHVGIIRGGTALNIVPDRCELDLEIRNIVQDSPTQFVESIRAHAGEVERQARLQGCAGGVTIEVTNDYPGLYVPEDHDVVELVKRLSGANECIRVAFGSEAGLYSRLGIPTVLCGPGSITHAHRADEYVTGEQLDRCDNMMTQLLEYLV